MPDDEVKRKIVQEAGVIIEDGRTFVSDGEGYIRFNIACPRSVLERALERIAAVFH